MMTHEPTSPNLPPAEPLADIVVDALWSRWKLVLALVCLTPIFAFFAWRVWPQKYEARARVTVRAPQEVNPFMQEMVVEWNAEDQTKRISSVLLNPTILEQVLRRIGTVHEHDDADAVDDAVREIRERMLVSEVGGGVVLLKLTSPHPAEAYRGVQALIDEFVREMLRPQRESVEVSARFLSDELTRVTAELEQMERHAATFRSAHVAALPEMRGATFAEHLALRTALVEAEVREQGTARQVQTVGERLRLLGSDERAVEAQLADARTNLVRSGARFGVGHPQVVAAEQRIERLQHALARVRNSATPIDLDRVDAIVPTRVQGEADGAPSDVYTSELLAYRTVLREYEGSSAQRGLLRNRLADVQNRIIDSIETEREVGRLERGLVALRAMQHDLRERFERAKLLRNFAAEAMAQQVWVLEPPRLPTRSNRPALPLVLVGALAGGLVLAFAIVTALEARSRLVRTPNEIATALRIRSVATVQHLGVRR